MPVKIEKCGHWAVFFWHFLNSFTLCKEVAISPLAGAVPQAMGGASTLYCVDCQHPRVPHVFSLTVKLPAHCLGPLVLPDVVGSGFLRAGKGFPLPWLVPCRALSGQSCTQGHPEMDRDRRRPLQPQEAVMAGNCTILTYPLSLFKLCLYLKYSVSTNDNLWLNTSGCNVLWSKPHLSSGVLHRTDSATWKLWAVSHSLLYVRRLVVSYTSDFSFSSRTLSNGFSFHSCHMHCQQWLYGYWQAELKILLSCRRRVVEKKDLSFINIFW